MSEPRGSEATRVAEIEARLAGITPWPWTRQRNWHVCGQGDDWSKHWLQPGVTLENYDRSKERIVAHVCGPNTPPGNHANEDFDFIAAAPEDIAWLIAELRAREAASRAEEVTDEEVRRTGVAHPGFCDDEFLLDFIEQAKGAGGLREDEVTRFRLIAQRLRKIDYAKAPARAPDVTEEDVFQLRTDAMRYERTMDSTNAMIHALTDFATRLAGRGETPTPATLPHASTEKGE